MITLTVISYNGRPSDTLLTAQFDELGGTIGRADHNQLMLPDPERTVSRVHAQVVYRNGKFAVLDRGSNPIMVNGRAVGNGREAAIEDNAELRIGGYVLSCKAASAAAAASSGSGAAAAGDPFADLFGPAANATRARAAPVADPLAAFGGPPPVPASPQARARSEFDTFPPRSVPSPGPAPASAPALGGIPDDWDPFAPDPASRQVKPSDLARSLGNRPGDLGLDGGAAAPAALIPDLAPRGGGNDSIDNLFGLGPGSHSDPLANSLLDAPVAGPNMAASADPIRSLNSAPKATAATASDALSDLQRPFLSPSRPAAAPTPAASAQAQLPVTAPLPPRESAVGKTGVRPANAVMSWDDPDSTSHTVIRPGPRRAAPSAASASAPMVTPPPAAPSAPAPATEPAAARARPLPAAATVPAAAASAGAGSSADAQALLAAFKEGLATPSVNLQKMTPELMRLIGELLRESAKGTVELLVARAAMKREVRAAATMILARENNPLKFSPSGEAALAHLLAPPVQGFMAAAPAMRDAYDDLRAHQIGFIAGMRAALEGVLARFDPASLESRLTQRSFLQSLLPGSRQARMWEAFNQLYAQIRSEASDDFHALFGKEFLKAYEEHIDKLKEGAR